MHPISDKDFYAIIGLLLGSLIVVCVLSACVAFLMAKVIKYFGYFLKKEAVDLMTWFVIPATFITMYILEILLGYRR